MLVMPTVPTVRLVAAVSAVPGRLAVTCVRLVVDCCAGRRLVRTVLLFVARVVVILAVLGGLHHDQSSRRPLSM
jgi:hypothetical protein